MTKITAIIQARTDSKRFPKKVLHKIEGRSMLWHIINRLKNAKNVEQVILATTTKKNDQILLKMASENNIIGFAGSEDDVLERFFLAAKKYGADPIIRITGDCPLIDYVLIDEMTKFFISHDYDYVSNTMMRTYPDGIDTEIFSFKALEIAYYNAKWSSEREHVTPYIIKNPSIFKIFNYIHEEKDLSYMRWSVDEKKDLKLIRKIYRKMKPHLLFCMADVLSIFEKNPSLLDINKDIDTNQGYLTSLRNDRIVKSD